MYKHNEIPNYNVKKSPRRKLAMNRLYGFAAVYTYSDKAYAGSHFISVRPAPDFASDTDGSARDPCFTEETPST